MSKRGPGRPPSGEPPRVRLTCYVPPEVADRVNQAFRREGLPSVSAWLSRVVMSAVAKERR